MCDGGVECVNMQSTVDWFKIYKVPAGKPLNKFAFDGKAQGKVCTEEPANGGPKRGQTSLQRMVRNSVLSKGNNLSLVWCVFFV